MFVQALYQMLNPCTTISLSSSEEIKTAELVLENSESALAWKVSVSQASFISLVPLPTC